MEPVGCGERLAAADGLVRQPAVDDADLAAAETALGARLPEELRELYRVSDGVFDQPGQFFVVWPLADVVARNRADWSDAETAGGDRQTLTRWCRTSAADTTNSPSTSHRRFG